MSDFVEKPIRKMLNKQNPEKRLKVVEQRTGARNSARVNDLGEIGINSNNGDYILVAGPYPGQQNMAWITDDTGVPVAHLFGTYIAGTGAGAFLTAQEKETGTYAVAQLATLLSTDDFSNLGDRPNFFIRSTGLGQFRFDGGTVDTLGSQGLGIYTNVNNTTGLNNILSLYSNSKGTAAAGFGVGIVFYIEDDGGNEEAAANLGARWTSAVNAAETAKYQASLKQGGTLYDYGLGLLKYIAAGNTTITTSETTLFDRDVPANWLAGDNVIRITFDADAVVTTARTCSFRIYYDDTLMDTLAQGFPTTTTNYMKNCINISSTGASAQRSVFQSERYNSTAGTQVDATSVGTAAETADTVKNIKLTAQLSGAVTSATARNFMVEYLNGTQ